MHYLATNPVGMFVFDEKNKLVKFIYLGDNPEETARKMHRRKRTRSCKRCSNSGANFQT
jgi:hypothetical protein